MVIQTRTPSQLANSTYFYSGEVNIEHSRTIQAKLCLLSFQNHREEGEATVFLGERRAQTLPCDPPPRAQATIPRSVSKTLVAKLWNGLN
jgi:hypothetical protein